MDLGSFFFFFFSKKIVVSFFFFALGNLQEAGFGNDVLFEEYEHFN